MYSITINLWLALLVLSLLSFLLYCILKIKKITLKNFRKSFFCLVYFVILIRFCFFPIIFLDSERLVSLYGTAGRAPFHSFVKLIPTKHVLALLQENDYLTIIVNLLILAPMSYFLTLFFQSFSLKKIFLFTGGIAAAIEFIQFIIGCITKYPVYICAVDDILLNMLGAGADLLFVHLLRSHFSHRKKNVSQNVKKQEKTI